MTLSKENKPITADNRRKSMFTVWLVLANGGRQMCGREMMHKQNADNIASELRQMGFVVVIEKWSV